MKMLAQLGAFFSMGPYNPISQRPGNSSASMGGGGSPDILHKGF